MLIYGSLAWLEHVVRVWFHTNCILNVLHQSVIFLFISNSPAAPMVLPDYMKPPEKEAFGPESGGMSVKYDNNLYVKFNNNNILRMAIKISGALKLSPVA